MKSLITNADDFGFTRDVNEGIVHAHRHGILTATTLMATGAAFEHAVELAQANPTLDVGVHLVLVGSPGYPPTVARTVAAVMTGRINVYDDLARQVEKVLHAGLTPTHLDTHKHTHLWPQVLNAVAQVSSDFRIPWVRRPFGNPFQGVLKKRGCRMTDHFLGFQMTGQYGAAELVTLIEKLPEGLSEFMCHPGFCGAELRASRTRLKESRQRELEALTSPEVRAAVERSGVQLRNYR